MLVSLGSLVCWFSLGSLVLGSKGLEVLDMNTEYSLVCAAALSSAPAGQWAGARRTEGCLLVELVSRPLSWRSLTFVRSLVCSL